MMDEHKKTIMATSKITALVGEYHALCVSDTLLKELEAGGVSEWAGYQDALLRAMAYADNDTCTIDFTGYDPFNHLDDDWSDEDDSEYMALLDARGCNHTPFDPDCYGCMEFMQAMRDKHSENKGENDEDD